MGQVGHLNELQDKYGDKGLSIIGVTAETPGKTDPWMEKHGAEYAYAYDKASKLMSAVGAGGYPSAALMDPAGNIIWSGHPSELNASLIEPALDGALPKPLWEWPKEAKKVKKAVMKGDLSKALAEAQALGEPGTEIRIAIEGLISGKMQSLETAQAEGDWLRVSELGDELEKSISGLPQEAKVEEILAALKANKDAQVVLKAQKKVQKISDKISSRDIKRKQIDKTKKELQKLASEYGGTAAERDAKNGLAELEKLRKYYLNR